MMWVRHFCDESVSIASAQVRAQKAGANPNFDYGDEVQVTGGEHKRRIVETMR